MQRNVKAGNRMVELKNGVIGPIEPRGRRVRETRPGDYPGVPEAYLQLAELYGPALMGPPLCDELMALLQHMFTEEEAALVRHLKSGSMMTAAQVAADSSPARGERSAPVILTERRHVRRAPRGHTGQVRIRNERTVHVAANLPKTSSNVQ